MRGNRLSEERDASFVKGAASEIPISEAQRLWKKGRVSFAINDGKDVEVNIEWQEREEGNEDNLR